MIQRISALVGYLHRSLWFSLTGFLYLILALVYWFYFFPPSQQTPDLGNYILVIAVFGMALAFLSTLTVAARANRAELYPVLVRLPSRPEYITAVLTTSLLFTFTLQLLIAGLALIRGPELSVWAVVELIPIWVSGNIVAAVLALHATDLAYAGWSRVLVFGVLAIFLLMQSIYEAASSWLATGMDTLGRGLIAGQTITIGNWFIDSAVWIRTGGDQVIGSIFSAPFWPFRAITTAVTSGTFTPAQALAPAIILLYATILFLIVADLFANKDLMLEE